MKQIIDEIIEIVIKSKKQMPTRIEIEKAFEGKNFDDICGKVMGLGEIAGYNQAIVDISKKIRKALEIEKV